MDSALAADGFFLIAGALPNRMFSEDKMREILFELGAGRARTAGYSLLVAGSSSQELPMHNEGIFQASGLPRLFALGCLQPSHSGGATRVFDARRAAARVLDTCPDYADVRIEYGSANYPSEKHVYSLVERRDTDTPVLRYRSRTPHNRIVSGLPDGVREEEFYERVDALTRASVTCAHRWSSGDVLIVNNAITLHDRLPFHGLRQMARVRFDDPFHVDHVYES